MPALPRTGLQARYLVQPDLLAGPPGWLLDVIIVLAILIAAAVYLWPSPFEFPMDDTYIHMVYAENLSEHGGLFFNTPDEKGVGTTSLLWVLILAIGKWAGLSMHWIAKLAGLAGLSVIGSGLYRLLRPLLSTLQAMVIALLVVLSGHMLWFALSGMETILFLALGILAVLFYRQEHWGWLGVALGLLAITRLEGLILALVIGLVDIWRRRSIRPGLLGCAAMTALICGPWVLYLWLRTGYILPTSGIGKHFTNLVLLQSAASRSQLLAWLGQAPALVYLLAWIGYSVEFILGGFALPAPYIQADPVPGSFTYKLSMWAILGLVTVVAPLLWLSFKSLVSYLKTPGWKNDPVRLSLLILFIWMLLHNLCYMIYLPTIGAASRYASLNHILLWLALGLGLWRAHRSLWKVWLAAGLLLIALANTLYWNRVYDSNLEHMLNVRIAAAHYVREQIPESEVCAAFDIGALRFYSRRPLVDLGGLIDPELSQWVIAGKAGHYLVENHVSCLIVPGRKDTTTDGLLDILSDTGLSRSTLFDLQQIKVFQIDRQRWLTGYLPTVHYQATVTIYDVFIR